MLYIGIIFIFLGIYTALGDMFNINILAGEKTIAKKEEFNKDDYFSLRLVVGLFAFIIGAFSLANYFLL